MDVGNRIKQLREQNKYSQNYLADIAGISQTHLRRVELGTADITVGHLQLVCDALGISLKDFFNVSGVENHKLVFFLLFQISFYNNLQATFVFLEVLNTADYDNHYYLTNI